MQAKGLAAKRLAVMAASLVVAAAVAFGMWRRQRPSAAEAGRANPTPARPSGPLTFNRDIAPIVYRQCAGCHRPGEAAPFPLLTYQQVRERAKDIVAVTHRRYMPPWLPEPGEFFLADERRLTEDEIMAFQQWADQGALEGAEADRPPLPQWTQGWQLGPPDLVVEMPEAYTLAAAGRDVYRNFVIPVPLPQTRFVRALEFRPNTRVLHHVFLHFDRTGQSRRLDAQDPEVGFGGMPLPPGTESAEGHFLTWQSGRGPTRSPEGLPWRLEPGRDLVLQAHLQPSGRPERVRAQIGFYFTNQPPTNTPFKLVLSSYHIDIPPGARAYEIQDSYVLPVDVELLAVLPHAHYLGRELSGFAIFPDGTRRSLLEIKAWDFNWQSDYRYQHPVFLPKGTRLGMRFTYDNSSDNIRNPHQPPVRVTYGLQSTDEMGELWLQFLPRNARDRQVFEEDYERRLIQDILALNELLLQQNPSNAHAHVQLAKALVVTGRPDEAMPHLRQAVRIDPNEEEAHYHLGVMLMQKDPAAAEIAFRETVRLNPENFKAYNNLGLILMRGGRYAEAETQFQRALELRPGDRIVQQNLNLLRKQK